MTGTFPALLALRSDAVVRAHPMCILVYLHCLDHLDFAVPRALKAWAVADALGLKPHTAGACLRLLAERGFLASHGPPVNRVYAYTLAWSLRSVPQGHTSSAA